MIVKDQYFEIKWSRKNKDYYESLGYVFSNFGDKFLVKAEDLLHGSHQQIRVVCDYCEEEYSVAVYNYYKHKKDSYIDKDACVKCKSLKTKETLQEKYQVNSPGKIPEAQEKMRQTNLERYGHTCCLGNKEIRQKCTDSLVKKYGVSSPMQISEVKEKVIEHFMEKYGAKNPMQTKEIREKMLKTTYDRYGVYQIMDRPESIQKGKETCKQRYGGESSQCSKEIRAKSMATLMKNGTLPRSKAEIEMCQKIKEIYGEDNCQEQYAYDRCFFDCLLTIKGIQIDIEFDGEFWHQDINKDDKRDWFHIRRGFKVLRFRSKGKVPTKEQIEEGVNYLVNSEHHKYVMNI